MVIKRHFEVFSLVGDLVTLLMPSACRGETVRRTHCLNALQPMLPVLKKRRLRKATKFSGTPSLFLARGAVSIYQTSPPAFSTAATAEFDWPAFCTALPYE